MNPIKINNRLYNYSIFPLYDKVYAEIYYSYTSSKVKIHAISKEFGSIFRKPIEQDYINAKQWANNQLKYIINANS